MSKSTQALSDDSLSELKERATEFARSASTELTTHDAEVIPELAEHLWPGATVYVAHTPRAKLEEVVRVAAKIESIGLRASPHIVARRVESERALRDALRHLRNAGVKQVLTVAGDKQGTSGPFDSSLEVLRSGLLTEFGFDRVGVAGHPEGHQAVESARLWDALREKHEFAQSTKINLHIVTQFGFSPEVVYAWTRQLRDHGISLPVHVGIAGPASLTKLLRFAIQCGVGASLNSVMSNISAVSNLARPATTPEAWIASLTRVSTEQQALQIVQPHIFAFGGVLNTARWLRAVSDGEFDVRSDGNLELY
jgi:methylenetetrahydrofolate reductase (NADPH)